MYDDTFLHSMAQFLYLLSGDPAFSTALPFCSHNIVRRAIEEMKTEGFMEDHTKQELKKYTTECEKLLQLSSRCNSIELCTNFLEYLIEKIELVHSVNHPVQEPEEIPDSYYPPGGTAYYFSESGAQVRRMPHYAVDGTSSRKRNYDDNPQVDKPCTKLYPLTAYGGFCYMFLFFCPIHGHSYGFHLINGGKGRKDPFCALFKYMPNLPEELFYDNACQLSEYALNREPGLFLNTRLWHDLFHSITHLCGSNFKSSRVVGLCGINTEICEQVNSYLQCVKYTASHLSQEHFVFFYSSFCICLTRKKHRNFRGKLV